MGTYKEMEMYWDKDFHIILGEAILKFLKSKTI